MILPRILIPVREMARMLLLAATYANSSAFGQQAEELSWKNATIVVSPQADKVVQQAARMLADEVEKRTHVAWPIRNEAAATDSMTIALSTQTGMSSLAKGLPVRITSTPGGPAESYEIQVLTQPRPVVWVLGADPRGVLFGVGRLLREMRMTPAAVSLSRTFQLKSAPAYPLRGHQLGYRPKTNSYDAWDVAMWEQYMRDLIVFGTNAIELIPPRSDDEEESPHFPLPKLQMMTEMSRLCDQYGLDVWIWYPAMEEDYANAKTVAHSIEEWDSVFRQLPRVDAVFVPGGDPGHTHPRQLMDLLQQQAQVLRKHHPRATLWMSPQGFSAEWMQVFVQILNAEQPDWLAGIVHGPQVRIPLPELRRLIPAKYPIRGYPDITHTRQCQFPVPDWDLAYALTEAREPINPRPQAYAHICHQYCRDSIGFITYSEGCNDDVNKIVWSALGWDPEQPVIDVLRQYSRYFVGDESTLSFAQGLLALEDNWRGSVLTNRNILVTLQQFQGLERSAAPQTLQNWRFQQALYRAHYDAYVRSRMVYETSLEEQALDQLRNAPRLGSLAALQGAEQLLKRGSVDPIAQDLRAKVFELGDQLFRSVKMQLSVPRHQAIGTERGANLDTIDMPLNNRNWLTNQIQTIQSDTSEERRLAAIAKIVHWKDPGPGGFYDDLGDPASQPHLMNARKWEDDPAFFQSPLIGFGIREWNQSANYPMSWWHNAEALHDTPLQLHYDNLDKEASYRIRVSYAGDMPDIQIRLVADDMYEIHPEIAKGSPIDLKEFPIPHEATRDGQLTLQWHRQAGLGGNGRGAQVAEVWLLQAASAPHGERIQSDERP